MRTRLALLSLVATLALGSLSLGTGCAAPADEAGPDEAQSESDLTAVKTGHYEITQKPFSGSYLASMTLSAGKKVEVEYVRVTTSTSSWFGNPWIQVPSTREEKMVLRGEWFTYASDGGTSLALDLGGSVGSLSYGLVTEGTTLRLKAIGEREFTMKAAAAKADTTDARVISCDDGSASITITLDEADRRRGTMKVTAKAGADKRSDPPTGSFGVVYTGDTGVTDYMGYEGTDKAGNGYDFALRKSDLEKTSGKISNVGLGFSPEYASYAIHHSLTCTISKK